MSEFSRFQITSTLIIINVAAYLLTAFLSGNIEQMDIRALVGVGALFGPAVLIEGQWWRLVSAMFLHGGITHLLMNMVSLYVVGRGVELYFKTSSYLIIYFFSGILGAMVSLIVHPQSVGVGASGAIFGLFGALAGFFWAYRERIGMQSKAFMKDFGVIIVINAIFGLAVPAVDMSAHIGGLITGLVGGFLLSSSKRYGLIIYTVLFGLMMVIGYRYFYEIASITFQ